MPARLSALLIALVLWIGASPALATSAPAAIPATSIVQAISAQSVGAFQRGTIARRPIVVMIDNHPGAYPQIGLAQATVVYEALAEFGITRFMAVYAAGISADAPQIGPVRSARLYFVQWAMGMRAMYAHAGGSPQALELLDKTGDVVNLDALRRNGGAYFTRSSKRSAPHNLFTSSAALDKAVGAFKAGELGENEVGFLFKSEESRSGGAAITKIDYYFLYKQESVGWTYDAASNSYLRLRRGKAAVDGASGKQLQTKNVVVIEVRERAIKGDPKGRIEQDVVGSGAGRVFLDGVQLDITWSKESAAAPLRLLMPDGNELHLNPGQVWISAVPSLDNITAK